MDAIRDYWCSGGQSQPNINLTVLKGFEAATPGPERTQDAIVDSAVRLRRLDREQPDGGSRCWRKQLGYSTESGSSTSASPAMNTSSITDALPEGWKHCVKMGQVLNALESGGRPRGGASEHSVVSHPLAQRTLLRWVSTTTPRRNMVPNDYRRKNASRCHSKPGCCALQGRCTSSLAEKFDVWSIGWSPHNRNAL